MEREPEAIEEWISLPAARRLLGVGPKAVKGLIARGLVGSRHVPGSHPKVRRPDLEAVLADHTTFARQDP